MMMMRRRRKKMQRRRRIFLPRIAVRVRTSVRYWVAGKDRASPAMSKDKRGWVMMVLASRAPWCLFGHTNPYKAPLGKPNFFCEEISLMLIEILDSIKFPWHCIRISYRILINIHVYGWNLSILWSPKDFDAQVFYINLAILGTQFLNPGYDPGVSPSHRLSLDLSLGQTVSWKLLLWTRRQAK